MSKFLNIIIFISFLISCQDPVTEIKENIFSAQDNSLTENEFNSTIEAMVDWVANSKLGKKSEQIIPEKVIVKLLDSTFLDGDGIEGSLDFGLNGPTLPYGLLCIDGKYRSGKIHFKLSSLIEIPGSTFQLTILPTDSFYSGSGSEMNLITGNIILKNLDGLSVQLLASPLTIVSNKTLKVEWNCDRTLRLLHDNGLGIWGDIFSITGTACGTNRNGEKFEATIDEPLIKKMDLDCSETFVKGKLSVKTNLTNKLIQVDYDPNKDEACDKLLEATINGKKITFRLN